MIFLLWNCRGAGSIDFLLYLKDLTTQYKPNLVILAETRITKDRANTVIPTFGFKNNIFSAVEGQSGGILVLWNDDIDIELVGKTRQELHLRVKVSTSILFYLSAIYCLNSIKAKTILWDNLFTVSKLIASPWLVSGDFNQIAEASEKLGGKCVSNKNVVFSRIILSTVI